MNTLAWITVVSQLPEDSEDRLPQTSRLVGLVVHESYEACGLVMRASKHLQAGTKCMIELGHFEPVKGSISRVWELEPGVVRVALTLVAEPDEPES